MLVSHENDKQMISYFGKVQARIKGYNNTNLSASIVRLTDIVTVKSLENFRLEMWVKHNVLLLLLFHINIGMSCH